MLQNPSLLEKLVLCVESSDERVSATAAEAVNSVLRDDQGCGYSHS